jgi:hypothetical protein
MKRLADAIPAQFREVAKEGEQGPREALTRTISSELVGTTSSATAALPEVPPEGLSLSEALNDAPIDAGTRAQFFDALTANFGINYWDDADPETRAHHAKAALTFRLAQSEGFGKIEFGRALELFLRSKRFAAHWTAADFFDYQRPRLIPYATYLKLPPDERLQYDAYKLEAYAPAWGKRREIGKLLRTNQAAVLEERTKLAGLLPAPGANPEDDAKARKEMLELLRSGKEAQRIRGELVDAKGKLEKLEDALRCEKSATTYYRELYERSRSLELALRDLGFNLLYEDGAWSVEWPEEKPET